MNSTHTNHNGKNPEAACPPGTGIPSQYSRRQRQQCHCQAHTGDTNGSSYTNSTHRDQDRKRTKLTNSTERTACCANVLRHHPAGHAYMSMCVCVSAATWNSLNASNNYSNVRSKSGIVSIYDDWSSGRGRGFPFQKTGKGNPQGAGNFPGL